LTIVRNAVLVAIFFTGIRHTIFITIWVAFVWNVVPIAIGGSALSNIALIRDPIVVAVWTKFTFIGDAVDVAVL